MPHTNSQNQLWRLMVNKSKCVKISREYYRVPIKLITVLSRTVSGRTKPRVFTPHFGQTLLNHLLPAISTPKNLNNTQLINVITAIAKYNVNIYIRTT